jgi:hypothetical protein
MVNRSDAPPGEQRSLWILDRTGSKPAPRKKSWSTNIDIGPKASTAVTVPPLETGSDKAQSEPSNQPVAPPTTPSPGVSPPPASDAVELVNGDVLGLGYSATW